MEQWKPVRGFEAIYEVSDQGMIRRITNSPGNRYKAGHVLTPTRVGRGYSGVVLHGESNQSHLYIHRIVGVAFCSPPDNFMGLQINHKNGVKTDNRAENLEWVTQSENKIHAHRVLGSPPPPLGIGENNGRAKLSETSVLQIRDRYKTEGATQFQLAQEFGVTPAMIGHIVRRDSWAHI